MKHKFRLIFSFLLMLAFISPAAKNNCPKLAVSAGKRFLTADGKPFFWLGDTGWLLLGKLNREETEKYLENRREKGFNVIQVMLLHTLSVTDSNGDSALIGKNPATPKVAVSNSSGTMGKGGYWEHVDFVVDLAAEKGIYLALVPVWGPNVRAGHVSLAQAESYARFLAGRYRDKSNIIWMNGGDVRGDDSIRIWNKIGNTLKEEAPGHLVTFHPFGRTQSSRWFHEEPWLDFNMFQSGHRNYDQDTSRTDLNYGEDNWRYAEADYHKMPLKPTLDGEPSYEGIPHGLHDTLQPRWTDSDLRRYAYWSLFSGACGFTYGNNSVMQMHKRGEKTGSYGAVEIWEEAVNAPGAGQMIHLKNLMLRYHFESLVPDQSLLAEPGIRYNHQVALRGTKCLMVYTWNGRPIRLKTDKIIGEIFRICWYSPKNGKYLYKSQVKKENLPELDPPGVTENGNDWVLIVESLNNRLFAPRTSFRQIPRDTTFTPYLAWVKLRNEFPQAKIVDATLPQGVIADYGVVYKTLTDTPFGKRDLHLDIFRPEQSGIHPVLLLIHGGGWRSGDRTMENPMAMAIASHGYVTASAEYRLSPEALYPAAVYDIKDAIRFLRANAKKFHIDPDRMSVSGTSAGGQLAALSGMTADVRKFEGDIGNAGISTSIQAIIDIDGILDFTDPNESAKDNDPSRPSAGAWWFGGNIRQLPEKWKEASPMNYAGKSTPPVLFVNSALPRFHAGRDTVISILNRFNIYTEVHTIPNTPHPFWLFDPWFGPTVDYVVAFLDKVLKKKQP
jgi:acetyl esterase/lipase